MHYLLIKIQLLWTKHTKWLDRNPVKVPVSKRLIAYAIDWAVGGIISGFLLSYFMVELLVDQICLVIFMFFLA